MKIVFLPLYDLCELYSEKVIFSPAYTEPIFDKEWQDVRDSLRIKMQSRWKVSCYGDADFALSDDRTNTWAQAGGIQNPKILSRDFSMMILGVLKAHPHSDKWSVSFNVHIKYGLLKLKVVSGHILFKNEFLYVAKYKNYADDLIASHFQS